MSDFSEAIRGQLHSVLDGPQLISKVGEGAEAPWSGPVRETLLRFLKPESLDGFERHHRLMQRWNPKLNLTRVTADSESARKHFLESLLAALLLEENEHLILDLGSGAGFPGLPIGVAFPERAVYLLEGDVRKAAFLKEAARDHKNIRVLNLRSDKFLTKYQLSVDPDELGKGSGEQRAVPEFPDRIDCVISRAVHWSDLSELAQRIGCPLVWITSAEEFARWTSSTWNVERKLLLPNNAGIVVRMFHMEHKTRMVG